LFEKHSAWVVIIEVTDKFGICGIKNVSVFEHPLASNTVTLLFPYVNPVAVCPVAPLDHENVYGGIPPVNPVIDAEPMLLEQVLLPVTVTPYEGDVPLVIT